ncbi:MAG: ComF family protein [Chloroflexi bacterium]|nr:MAG: ComF family protein [Chloroflexota bacterium]
MPLLDFLLPPRCGGCRAVGSWLCERCRSRIRRLEEPLCRRCGAELPSARRDCGCRARLKSLSRLRSAVAYEGPIERAVHRFKYEGWRRLAAPLALLIAERLAVEGVGARWVVSVPLHPERLSQRGFNQAELLAGELRRRLRLGSKAESILLIDDVATTGATLDACASALRAAGSGPVTGVSVARVNV